MAAKIIRLKDDEGLFPKKLRERIEASVEPYTTEPARVVDQVEQVLGAAVTDVCLGAAKALGSRIGSAIGKMFLD